MGDRLQAIVDLDATGAQARRLADRVVEWLAAEGIVLAERTPCVPGRPLGHPPGPHWHRAVTDDWDWPPSDGLAVHTVRTGFTSGADMPGAALCPRCGAATALDDAAWRRFGDAMRTWHDEGTASAGCPACGTAVPLPDWTWDEAPLAFGSLGLEFWNWPELTPEFRARTAEVLDGHRTAYVWGKL
ncbi:hypothetical protein [Streptomyces griseomycini]|uniref:Ribosomal protein S27AE n=1 Tax=Streptomyces griseomycini TaxID=66895 RepID=A0A7W7M171_9ACTN|nr:hypothetical protein [Streptomyces griseomycini]MBB4900263.1 ribosomal protein S27AE [Streptomyces griseomycini]GGR25763.1 hypothetical protein GCM10015536_34180 [Streptomyces griseomycini]